MKVKDTFYKYFSDGYKPAEAATFHKTKIIEEFGHESLADASINPTENQITYMYQKWKNINEGTIIDPFQKLIEKRNLYEEAGMRICLILYFTHIDDLNTLY